MRKIGIATTVLFTAAMMTIPSTIAEADSPSTFTQNARVYSVLDSQADVLQASAVKDAAQAQKRAQAGSRTEKANKTSGHPRSGPSAWIHECVRAADVPESWYKGLYTIARRESGLNPSAYNGWDINAKNGIASRGLMQTIPETFKAYHEPGTSWDIYDPVANCAAAVNYIKSRYGHISNVQQADSSRPPLGY